PDPVPLSVGQPSRHPGDRHRRCRRWKALTVRSVTVGRGSVTATAPHGAAGAHIPGQAARRTAGSPRERVPRESPCDPWGCQVLRTGPTEGCGIDVTTPPGITISAITPATAGGRRAGRRAVARHQLSMVLPGPAPA